jgi:hypothetical protein
MSYTLTTNLSLKLPEIGGSTDTWGQNLLDNFTSLDSTINTIQTDLLAKAATSDLSGYVGINTTGLTNYTTTANTVLSTASDVTVTSPATNDFLVYSGASWVNKTKAQAQVSLLPTYGTAGEVLRIATGGSSLEWATLGFQFSYTSGGTDPSSGATNGDLFFNTSTNELKIYNNGWVSVVDTDATTPTTGDVIALSIALG